MAYNQREFTEGIGANHIGPSVQPANPLVLFDDFSTDPGASGWILAGGWSWERIAEDLAYTGFISYFLT